ncbi:MAG: TolC family protein [Bacteroidia bacterium]|nr:TolC family protein [Bacteroidia bacterium]
MNKYLPILWFSFLLLPMCGQAQDGNIWSLKRCLDHAMENNLTLQQAKLNQQSSSVNLLTSKAARYPNLNIGPQWSSSFGRSIDPTTNEFIDQRFDALNISGNSNITLWNYGRLTKTIEKRELDLEASNKDVTQAEYDLALNVTLAYLNILFQAEILESAELQVTSTEEQLERTQKLVKAGSLAQADLAQIQSQIATEELQVVNAQNTLELAYLSLQQLLRLDPDQPFGIEKPELEDPSKSFSLTPTKEIFAFAEQAQPSITAADLRVKSAEKDIKIAEASMYPSLTLGVSVFTAWSGGRLQQVGEQEVASVLKTEVGGIEQNLTIFSNQPIFGDYPFFNQLLDNYNVGLGLRLDIPIYNRRSVKSNMELASIGVKQAQLSAELARQSLQQAIEQAYVDARNAYSTYTSTTKQVGALELTYDNIQRQYDLGAANSVDFLVAKNNLNRAKFDLLRAKYDYLFRSKILDFYQGKDISFD